MNLSNENTAILILAAGSSSRMGTPKQILPWGDTTLLGNAIQNAKATGISDIYVVLGANERKILDSINERGIIFISNEDWEKGLGTSITAGFTYFHKANKKYNGVLIMLGDQPLLDVHYLTTVLLHYYKGEKSIVATTYGKRVGVPAIFGSPYFQKLRDLKTDYGAKEILKEHADQIYALDPKGKAIDVDTLSDYRKLKEQTFKK